MYRTGIAFARLCSLAVAAALLTALSGSAASSSDNCRRLEDLARQYAGVQLTSEQQQIKRRLVAWYKSNCKPMQRSAQR
jgi:hypothetical protein